MCETHPGESFWLRKMIMWIYGKWVDDTLDFYIFLGRFCKVPLIGPIVRFFARTYGRYYHGGYAATVEECLEILTSARQIGVADCACRGKYNNCNSPIRTCITINTGADVFGPMKNQDIIDVRQAEAILRQSYENGLIRAVHHCIAPHTYAICNCCTCCCVPYRLRSEFGIETAIGNGAMAAGIDAGKCKKCGSCADVCPQKAINIETSVIDPELCLGCGLCEGACAAGAVEMSVRDVAGRAFANPEPGTVKRLFMYASFVFVILPLAIVFKLLNTVRRL